MIKFKIGDLVKITSGKDRGKSGKIEKIFPDKLEVLILGMNIYKKHVKGSAVREGGKGGIFELARPLSFAKISLVCPKCKKTVRVGFKEMGEEKLRICKKCKKELDTK